MDCDDVALDIGQLEQIKLNLTASQEDLKALELLRQQNPDTPFALPESYMWAIGAVKGYGTRISCWYWIFFGIFFWMVSLND